jgi:apolipoprotein N-acyltransferase
MNKGIVLDTLGGVILATVLIVWICSWCNIIQIDESTGIGMAIATVVGMIIVGAGSCIKEEELDKESKEEQNKKQGVIKNGWNNYHFICHRFIPAHRLILIYLYC